MMIVRFIQKEPLVYGPVFLLCALAFAIREAIPYDLLLVAGGGFLLSTKLQIRGCCYALLLLGLISIARHAFFTTNHLWALGIEGSLGLSLFITALASEQGGAWIRSLESQIETRKSALENLEEEFIKARETAQELQIAFQEKVAYLQKELEETQAEHSSILVLNEVLRKTTAKHLKEVEEVRHSLSDTKYEVQQLKKECIEAEKELIRLKNSDHLVIENQKLTQVLNQVRYEREQTDLLNETLTRLHIRDGWRIQEDEEELSNLKAQLRFAHEKIQSIEKPLQDEISEGKRECEHLRLEFDKLSEEAHRIRQQLVKFQEIQIERNFLKERLDAATTELAHQKPVIDPAAMERLKFAEEKIQHLSQIEPLFKQLKEQFKEKNQLLHEVRSDLFRTDTELQRLKIEKEALDLTPIPKELEEELEGLTLQLKGLQEENDELQDLVTFLSEPSERKKKVKTRQSSSSQTLLFHDP